MHLLFALFFALFAAVCSGLDGLLKSKKNYNYKKSLVPAGPYTEFNLCEKYYKEYRDLWLMCPGECETKIKTEMSFYPSVKNTFGYLSGEQLVERWAVTKARIETAKQGKAPVCLTGIAYCPVPIPNDNYAWAVKAGQSPLPYVKMNIKDLVEKQREHLRMEEERSATKI